jgi:hypothetical protein
MRVNTMEDDSVFEEEGEERDSFVQPSRGLRSFALVSWLFSRTWNSRYIIMASLVTSSCSVADPGPGSEYCPSRIRIKEFKNFNPKICS